MVRMCRPTFVLSKAVVLGSIFFVAKGITDIEAKGMYVGDLIKKRSYWSK